MRSSPWQIRDGTACDMAGDRHVARLVRQKEPRRRIALHEKPQDGGVGGISRNGSWLLMPVMMKFTPIADTISAMTRGRRSESYKKIFKHSPLEAAKP